MRCLLTCVPAPHAQNVIALHEYLVQRAEVCTLVISIVTLQICYIAPHEYSVQRAEVRTLVVFIVTLQICYIVHHALR